MQPSESDSVIILTSGEVAKRAGVSGPTVWRWITKGVTIGGVFLRLRASQGDTLSRSYTVALADLEEFSAAFKAARLGTIAPRCRAETETETRRRGLEARRRFLESVGRHDLV